MDNGDGRVRARAHTHDRWAGQLPPAGAYRTELRTAHVTFTVDLGELREFAPDGEAVTAYASDTAIARAITDGLCTALDATCAERGWYTGDEAQLAYAVCRALHSPQVEVVAVDPGAPRAGEPSLCMDAWDRQSQDEMIERIVCATEQHIAHIAQKGR